MKKVIIALMVLGVCGTSVFAGEWKKDGSFGLGYVMPMGDTADVVDGSVGFGFEYEGYKINDMFSVGAGFFYNNNKGKNDATVSGVTMDLSSYKFSTTMISPFVKASKEIDLAGKKANIYGTLGIGFYTSDATVPAGSTYASSTDMGFNLGGGIMYPLADKMNLGFELKYHTVSADELDWSYLVPTAKFTYSF